MSDKNSNEITPSDLSHEIFGLLAVLCETVKTVDAFMQKAYPTPNSKGERSPLSTVAAEYAGMAYIVGANAQSALTALCSSMDLSVPDFVKAYEKDRNKIIATVNQFAAQKNARDVQSQMDDNYSSRFFW